jgi:hypothetical protein
VARYNPTTGVTEGDRPVRVLRQQGAIQPTSDGEPTFRTGVWFLRNGHVAFAILEDGVSGSYG